MLAFLKKPWVIQGVGVLALSILIWFIGPFIAIAGKSPLESDLVRGLLIAALFVGWIIWQLVKELQSARKDQAFVGTLGEIGTPSTPSAGKNENAELDKTFREALKVLRETLINKGGDSQYLYELPWYLMIGPPGSGKTTALFNSGLKFPLADRLGKQPIKGVGGTRHCDWLFTDEAVLIDTAGRYVTQETHQVQDAEEWQKFLALLKQYRPHRPINGVLVALSISELLQYSEEECIFHAKTVRQRIQELHAGLGIRFPVYLLFTKCDLIAGFTDFFSDLGETERMQVWGETLPAEDPQNPLDIISWFNRSYDEWVERLQPRIFRRLYDERDLDRRSMILDFPQQISLLKPLIRTLLDGIFSPSRYEAKSLLRGVYFTSSTQKGRPIDQMIEILARSFQLDIKIADPTYSPKGRCYFLTRLLKEVVFAEAELAGIDLRVERRQRWQRIAFYTGVSGISVILIVLWAVSYHQNRSAMDHINQALTHFHSAEINTTDTATILKTILPKLEALKEARDVYKSVGLFGHFGLYQGEKLGQAIHYSYEAWLKHYFLPVIQHRALIHLTESATLNDPDRLYGFLKLYLMLSRPEKMNTQTALPWIHTDWEEVFSDEPQVLQQLNVHLNELFSLPLEPIQIDETTVAMARSTLTQTPQRLQVYTRLKNELLSDTEHNFRLVDILSPEAKRLFTTENGKDMDALTISGLYTTWGYADVFFKKGLTFVKESLDEAWVLNDTPISLEPDELHRLYGDVRRLYLSDYQNAWKSLLSNLRLRSTRDIQQTIDWLDILSRPDSPVKSILRELEKNTTLSKLSPLNTPLLNGLPGKNVVRYFERDDPVKTLEAVFEPLNVLVRGTSGQAVPLDAYLKTLNGVHNYLLQATSALSEEKMLPVPSGEIIVQARSEFGRLPEPVRSWFLSLLQTGTGAVKMKKDAAEQEEAEKKKAEEAGKQAQAAAEEKAKLNNAIRADVGSACKAALENRYPFDPGSRIDVTLGDFQALLGPNGKIDQFFQDHIKNEIESHPDWTDAKLDHHLGLPPGTLRRFRNAEKIQSAFFPAGNATLTVIFELKPLSLDANVATFRLQLEGQEVTYRHGPEQIAHLQWPGPNRENGTRFTFETFEGKKVQQVQEGNWGWFRILDDALVEKTNAPERFLVSFSAENYTARYELRALTVNNPFHLPELHMFSCPDAS